MCPQLRQGKIGLSGGLSTGNIGIYVFAVTVGGTVYYVAVRFRAGGYFVLIDWGAAVPGRVINSALAYANTSGLGLVNVCGADYPLEVAVSYPANELTLQGMGRITYLDGDALGANINAINITGRTDCTVRDLAVRITDDGPVTTGSGVWIEDGSDRFTVENVTVIDAVYGIRVDGTSIDAGWIIDCKILTVYRDGINLQADAANIHVGIKVLDNEIVDTDTNNGILLLRCDNTTVCNNTCLSGILGMGINVTTCNDCIFTDNEINGTSNDGIILTTSHQCIVANNYLYSTGNDGISATGCDRINISGNNIEPGIASGIRIESFADPCAYPLISNNTINNGQSGIFIDTGSITNGLIEGNHIYSPSNIGINIQGILAYSAILNNDIIGDSSTGSGIDFGNSNGTIGVFVDGNFITGFDQYGITISGANCDDIRIGRDNYLLGNALGCINDLGTDTKLPEINELVQQPNGNIGLHPSIILTDGISSVTGTIEFVAPSNFQELVRAGVILVAGGTGDLRHWSISEYGKRCHDEAYNVHEGSVAVATRAVTANELECIDVTGALASLDQYDTVALCFGRAGADALDTVNEDCYLLGYYMEYV